MATDFKLLRYVPNLPESVRAYCARREQAFPYFREGFVDAGLGRHIHLTEAIRDATEGYGVADSTGAVAATYSTLQRAEEAMSKARPRFIPDLDLEPETATTPAGVGS